MAISHDILRIAMPVPPAAAVAARPAFISCHPAAALNKRYETMAYSC